MTEYTEVPSEQAFRQYQRLVSEKLGIHLPDTKRAMLGHRLLKRLRALEIEDFDAYFQYINRRQNEAELTNALELVTTNETFFFREIQHFDFLQQLVLGSFRRNSATPLRIWSAACSTGEEPYSIAMLLSKYCLREWVILATDVNESVLQQAKKGIYLDDRMSLLSDEFRARYCRKGTDEFEGYLRVIPSLRRRITFEKFNLIEDMAGVGNFDVIFLRNVLIYFDEEGKTAILNRVAQRLKPGGFLFTGHSESFHGVCSQLESIQPAILQRRLGTG